MSTAARIAVPCPFAGLRDDRKVSLFILPGRSHELGPFSTRRQETTKNGLPS